MEMQVSREDLDDGSSEAPSSPQSVNLVTLPDFEYVQQDAPSNMETADEEMAFNLFAPSLGAAPAQNIRLKSPTPEVKDPAFVVPRRHSSYYFSSDQQVQAISRADLQTLAAIKWTGMAYDWKVTTLPVSQLTASAKDGLQTWTVEVGKRRRPGKKARIKHRIAQAAIKAKAAAGQARANEEKAAREAREAHQLEKKRQRNREKQRKQRQRNKAKAEGSVAADDGDEVS